MCMHIKVYAKFVVSSCEIPCPDYPGTYCTSLSVTSVHVVQVSSEIGAPMLSLATTVVTGNHWEHFVCSKRSRTVAPRIAEHLVNPLFPTTKSPLGTCVSCLVYIHSCYEGQYLVRKSSLSC